MTFLWSMVLLWDQNRELIPDFTLFWVLFLFLCSTFFLATAVFVTYFLKKVIFKIQRKKRILEKQRLNWVEKMFQISTGRKSACELLWNLNECWSSPVIFIYLFPSLTALPAFPTLSSKWPQKGQLRNRNYLWAEEQKQLLLILVLAKTNSFAVLF